VQQAWDGGRAPEERRRDVSVTKDVLAAITFLATGLLFLLAQAATQADRPLSEDLERDAGETVVVVDGLQGPSDELDTPPPVTWDS
jgi:hypothetical protein